MRLAHPHCSCILLLHIASRALPLESCTLRLHIASPHCSTNLTNIALYTGQDIVCLNDSGYPALVGNHRYWHVLVADCPLPFSEARTSGSPISSFVSLHRFIGGQSLHTSIHSGSSNPSLTPSFNLHPWHTINHRIPKNKAVSSNPQIFIVPSSNHLPRP